jgi:hypothetical protein
MNRLPKFVLAENPMDTIYHRVFIIHMRDPVVIAEALHYDLMDEDEWMRAKAHYTVGASLEYEDELICIGAIFIGPGAVPEKLPGLMSRMGDWYHAYLDWEDSQDAEFPEL